MKTLKLKLYLIFALAVAFVATMGVFLAGLCAKADRSVSLNGSSIFYTSGDASVWAHKETFTQGEGSYDEFYTMFVLKNETDAVNYRKNLAYNWFYNSAVKQTTTGEGDSERISYEEDLENPVKAEGYLNMEIGFEKTDFEKFVIAFESQQYVQTKDEKSTNYVIFAPAETEGKLIVSVAHKSPDDEELEDIVAKADELGEVTASRIKIALSNKQQGTYTLTISDAVNFFTSEFDNVGGYYAKYSSSSTTPVTPISLKALFKDGEGEDKGTGDARMVLYTLNGQDFRRGSYSKVTTADVAEKYKEYYVKSEDGSGIYRKVKNDEEYNAKLDYYKYNSNTTESGDHFTGGTINDTTPPVLCLDKEISYVENGEELSFSYTVLDVIASSPSTTTSYFMLTDSQKENGDFKPDDISENSPYLKVKDSDDQHMIPHREHYLPTAESGATLPDIADFTASAAVKVNVKLTDTTSTGGTSTHVLLDWYVKDNNLVKVNGNNYIAVATDKVGATFGYTNTTDKKSDPKDTTWEATVNAYKQKVAEAVTEQQLKAGSKNYFYLPSVESLFSDNITNYEGYNFAIYYNNGSNQSSTGKAYNKLSINLNKTGEYIFTVYAEDAAGNPMWYYDKDGERQEFETGDIWDMRSDDEKSDYLPWFSFRVGSAELTIEDPGEQSIAYVGKSYSVKAFEINGVSTKETYKLYRFENALYFEENGKALTYSQFMEDKEKLFNENGSYFTEIYELSSMDEDDEEYELYKDYAWSASGRSFTPQDNNALYLVVCTSESTENFGQQATAYMGISASPKVRPLKGEDTWLRDNMASVILLCVAGASLIGIVLLIVIKPKEKEDVDIVVEEKKNKKRK